MKKRTRKIIFIILGIILLYSIFLVEESIRLYSSPYAKPLIIIKENTNIYTKNNQKYGYYEEEYISIGLKLKKTYIQDIPKDPNSDALNYHIEKSSCSLFNHFTVWEWIN